MIDLHFAVESDKRQYRCSKCPKMQQQLRKCDDDGFEQFSRARRVGSDKLSDEYRFCPGKATWYDEVAELFYNLRMAYETHILPKPGDLIDQDAEFWMLYPWFVSKWSDRSYARVWADVSEFTPKVLEAFAKMWGAKR